MMIIKVMMNQKLERARMMQMIKRKKKILIVNALRMMKSRRNQRMRNRQRKNLLMMKINLMMRNRTMRKVMTRKVKKRTMRNQTMKNLLTRIAIMKKVMMINRILLNHQIKKNQSQMMRKKIQMMKNQIQMQMKLNKQIMKSPIVTLTMRHLMMMARVRSLKVTAMTNRMINLRVLVIQKMIKNKIRNQVMKKKEVMIRTRKVMMKAVMLIVMIVVKMRRMEKRRVPLKGRMYRRLFTAECNIIQDNERMDSL